jgi:branched-subunit amino acid aminotransferase/4-amino-4-deoxychorismate lyase
MIAFYNNNYIQEEEIRLSPFSTAFQYGNGFFTTLRYYKGTLSLWEHHKQRLEDTAAYFNWLLPEIDLRNIIMKLIELNGDKDYRIKISIFMEDNVSIIIRLSDLNLSKSPRSLKMSYFQPDLTLSKFKTNNYLTKFLNLQLVKKDKFDDVLFIDEKNRLLETAIANIFFVSGNEIITPSLNFPILPGTARKEVIQKIALSNYSITESEISVRHLIDLDYCFLTNSVHGIVAIKSIDFFTFETNLPSEILALDII